MKSILYAIEQTSGKISKSLAIKRITSTPVSNPLEKLYQKFDLVRAMTWPIKR